MCQFSNLNNVHTNGIYHRISTKYLQNYVNEFCFKMNNKNNAFNSLISNCLFA
ncbi:MAG: transposase [Endomicrobium sp.]|nr:transposase [Endomicrobium sp.]